MEPIELLTVSECARRKGLVRMTLSRAIERNRVQPDAVLIEGPKHLRSPLFVASRLKELTKLVEASI